ncbi:hypothetical protein MKW94_018366 [Papaver nudicaule]|uniref:TF-B3 domain-containing protein n=1 Tax=Papaver nudicaule TaxID=74823 RepID=A0AA41VE74_PAPNU|nr:hypothetical protein [Papaver nudicaule]
MEKPASSSYKPHFFQPILPGSSSAHVLSIPKAFQRDYLVNGEDSEGIATLKSPLKSWKVKMNDFKFTEGWGEFFKAHNLIEYPLPKLMSDESKVHHGEKMGKC